MTQSIGRSTAKRPTRVLHRFKSRRRDTDFLAISGDYGLEGDRGIPADTLHSERHAKRILAITGGFPLLTDRLPRFINAAPIQRR